MVVSRLITADQLFVHAVGDYIIQSDWMAQNKTKAHWPAFCHALIYSLGFLVFAPSWKAWLVIFGTHFLIDRYRLARYIVWAKNWVGRRRYWVQTLGSEWQVFDCEPIPQNHLSRIYTGPTPPFTFCSATGYPPTTPAWLSVWLMIIADNILHVGINAAALRWL